MKLERSCFSPLPSVPKRLSNRVYVTTTCMLSFSEIQAFENVLRGLDALLSEDESVNPNMYISIICSDRDTVCITIDDPDALGRQLNLAILPIRRWRMRHLNQLQMDTCIAEELCHYFWNITDENLVRFQVLSLLQRIRPIVQLSDVYDPNWTPDDN